MASLQERCDKRGKLVSYSIRVHRGRGADGRQLKPWTETFKVQSTWSEKTARKKAEAFAATFKKECRGGMKHSTIVRYKELTRRIYPQVGHIKLRELRADQLNEFIYPALAQDGQNKRTGGGLSAKTIMEHHRLISTVLEQAVLCAPKQSAKK